MTIEDIAAKHGIRLILQFGSTVTGKTHPQSDIDIAVQLGRADVDWSELSEIESELQHVAGDRPVDLVLIDRADPLLLKQITQKCRLLFGTERALHELKIYAFRRYQDHKKYFAMEREWIDRELAKR